MDDLREILFSSGSPVKSFAVTRCSIWVLTLDLHVYMHSRSEDFEPSVGSKVCWKQVELNNQSPDQV